MRKILELEEENTAKLMYFQSTFDSVLFLTAQDSNPD
jgi:hypothetical protein